MGFSAAPLDPWTALSYKRSLGNHRAPGTRYTMPVWVGDHQRRLLAYSMLQAYLDNTARDYLPTADGEDQNVHREYGDPALLRDTILDAVLGQSQQIEVDGAADEPAAELLQDWLRAIWEDEHGQLKLIEAERDAVGLGDAVYSIGWSPEKGRPRLRVWDPGFYFPVLEDGNEDDFPEKVHVAWEVVDETLGSAKAGRTTVRRLTWELIPLDSPVQHPWNDQPSFKTCVYSDASFSFNVGNTSTLDNLDELSAIYATDSAGVELRRADMGIDFLPVVHLPNTVSIKDHYGRSSIAIVLQLLDDIASVDTDLGKAAVTVARPTPVLSKGSLGDSKPTYEPGEVWEVGDGSLTLPDTSRSLDALIKYAEQLLGRLSVNARVPEALMGRVKPSEVPSGVAMALSFGPLAGMVGKMRLVRDNKYELLFRFIWRMAVAGRMPGVPADWYRATLTFGSYLPSDQASVVALVVQLRQTNPPVISAETAVDILITAGLAVDDAQQEVDRVQERDFAGAAELRAATDSLVEVGKYLGIQLEESAPVPTPPPIIVPAQLPPPVPPELVPPA